MSQASDGLESHPSHRRFHIVHPGGPGPMDSVDSHVDSIVFKLVIFFVMFSFLRQSHDLIQAVHVDVFFQVFREEVVLRVAEFGDGLGIL